MDKLRQTTQYLLPVAKPELYEGEYDIYPVHDLGPDRIRCDYTSLAFQIASSKTVIIDGYTGVRFDLFMNDLNRELNSMGISPKCFAVHDALRSQEEIECLTAPFLGGDDPLFGKRTTLELADFYNKEKLKKIKPEKHHQLNIIYGEGAALAGWGGLLIYIDIPKNEIQFRARAGTIFNLGQKDPFAPKTMYKRFYFVDWIVLNRHKKRILKEIDIFIDGQRDGEITWMTGKDLREGLQMLSRSAFRVRPWFEPGPWGGQWIKKKIRSLSPEVPSYAWSFELIVPENGIIFSSSSIMLEVSFDLLMYSDGRSVVGDKCNDEYGDEFPIRMDYLDTFDGGNLSVQCHPRKEYINKNFNEVLTQEETYYILDKKDDAVVFLGFRENIDPEEFERALTESYENKTPLDVPRFINALPSEKHSLFLIPPGTLHSSGRNNLVLEISTTPYIFTFKMYDWLSLDLDGKPRPLNIRRAIENLYFDRKGDVIREEFISKPYLLEKGDGWELYHLPTHKNHSYDVHRYKLKGSVNVKTEGKCHVLNLVEGRSVEVQTISGKIMKLSYGETLVISAGAVEYTLVNNTGDEAMLVKAFMK